MAPYPSYFFNNTITSQFANFTCTISEILTNPLNTLKYFIMMSGGPIFWGSAYLGFNMMVGYLHTKSAFGAGIAAILTAPAFMFIAELRILAYIAIALGVAPIFKKLVTRE